MTSNPSTPRPRSQTRATEGARPEASEQNNTQTTRPTTPNSNPPSLSSSPMSRTSSNMSVPITMNTTTADNNHNNDDDDAGDTLSAPGTPRTRLFQENFLTLLTLLPAQRYSSSPTSPTSAGPSSRRNSTTASDIPDLSLQQESRETDTPDSPEPRNRARNRGGGRRRGGRQNPNSGSSR